MAAPIDIAERDRATGGLQTSFAVSAGAGAGKTSVLVARLVGLLAGGLDPRHVAAITFTEKAAGELQSRVRDALEARQQTAAGPAAEARHVRAALDRFGELQISTIHSFCRRLLQHEALAAGWAPDTTLTGDQPDPALDALYDAWRRGFDRRHPDWAHLAREMTSETSPFPGVASIREAARAMLDNRDLEPLCAAEAEAVLSWEDAWRSLRALCREVPPRAARCRSPAVCKLLAKCRPLLDGLAGIAADLPARQGVMAGLTLEPVRPGKLGNKQDWEPRDKEAFLEGLSGFAQWWEGCWRALGATLHRLLVLDLRAHYLAEAQALRRERASADFADLLFRARDLLAEDPAARRRLARRYRALLVDEVQDTDPIQAEVAALLARPPEAAGPWEASPPRPGSLFAVGDLQQSIYRFRRADVETWSRLQALIGQAGEALTLRQNFRSVPGVIRWVNHAFSEYPGYRSQEGWREPGRLPPVVTLHSDDPDAEAASEIDAAVRHIHHLLAAGAEVYDPEARGWRAIRARDVMILLPSWTAAGAIQEQLTLAGIGSVVEGGSAFFAREEVRLLTEAMQAIEEPGDSEAILCTLRGLFGVSFSELAAHRAQGGRWDYTTRGQPPGPASAALEVLRRLHRARQHLSWVPLLDALLARTGAPACWALTPHRTRVLSNLDKLRALIRQVETDTYAPAEVIAALRRLALAGTADLSTWDEEADAVRITTVFKAKGLEAPVVVMLCANRRLESPTAIVERRRRTLALRAGAYVHPPGWAELEEAEREELAAERRRWMYVAATRARDQLVLVASPKSKLYEPDIARGLADPGTSHGVTLSLAPGVEVLSLHRACLPDVPYERATFPGLDAEVDARLAEPAGVPVGSGWQGSEADIAAARKRSVRWRSLERPRRREGASDEWIGPRWGRAAWRALLRTDPAASATAARDEALGHLAEEAGLMGLDDAEQQQARGAVLSLLAQPAFDEARAAILCLRDVPLLLQEENTILSGRIDLCFPLDAARQRWRILDWKVALQHPSPSFLARYPSALAGLARRLLGCQHVEVVLLQAASAAAEAATPESVLEDLLEDVRPELIGLIRRLAALDPALLPEPYFDVGEPRIYTQLELAWAEPRVGLAVDLPEEEQARLQAEGWEVVAVRDDLPGWADEAVPAILALLGVAGGGAAEDGEE